MSAFTQALQRMFDARPARPCSANDAQRPSPSHGDADVHHSRAGPPLAAAGDVLGGRFELIALIGEGGMSRVFKALDLRRQAGEADRHVAVKVLTEPFDA